jgi:hypothetical protein
MFKIDANTGNLSIVAHRRSDLRYYEKLACARNSSYLCRSNISRIKVDEGRSMTMEPTRHPSFSLARGIITAISPEEVDNLNDYESSILANRSSGLEFGTTDVIAAIGPIAYLIAGMVVKDLSSWAIKLALDPFKSYVTEKGRAILGRWVIEPSQAVLTDLLTERGKKELLSEVREACRREGVDEAATDRILIEFARQHLQ